MEFVATHGKKYPMLWYQMMEWNWSRVRKRKIEVDEKTQTQSRAVENNFTWLIYYYFL